MRSSRKRLCCMASAALSIRLPRARLRASGSAMTRGRPGVILRTILMVCMRPAKRASEFSTMVFRSAGLGRAVGNSASAANWSTRERMLSTEEVMTSLQRRMTATEGGSARVSDARSARLLARRSMWRRICSALRLMGVRGFLISWATRRATSFQADCFCARSSSVAFSRTRT